MDNDPYAPPASIEDPAADQKPALREIVLAWEKLRLIYNGLLAIPGALVLVMFIQKGGMPVPAAVISAAFVALGANACFFLGPLAELYLRGLFRRGEPIGRGRWLIFGAGVVFSLGTFLLALLILYLGSA